MYLRDSIWGMQQDHLTSGSVAQGDMRNADHNIVRQFVYNDPETEQFGDTIPYSHMYKDLNFQSIIFPVHAKLTTDQFPEVAQWPGTGSYLFRNVYAIRLPMTYFLRAEAYLRNGQSQEAADDINVIRQRAGCNYLVNSSELDIDFILDERARELYVEERRWNTLLRMRGTVAVDRIRKYSFWDATRATLTFDYNRWPIPQDVIDRNKDIDMRQNPGWEGR
mgnify:FL=1